LETFLTVMQELEPFPAVADEELRSHAPLLASAALLVAAADAGAERSRAHTVLQRHSAAAVAAQRTGQPYDLAAALGEDDDFPLSRGGVEAVLNEAIEPGLAEAQVADFVRVAADLLDRYPLAGEIAPEPLL